MLGILGVGPKVNLFPTSVSHNVIKSIRIPKRINQVEHIHIVVKKKDD